MKKIPSVFLRNPDNMNELLREINPQCQWVIDGEGVATRKYDGTCVMMDDDYRWWVRREVKPGKEEPPNWVELDFDPVTEKRMGWEPYFQSGFKKMLEEAIGDWYWAPGTYELIGPKINGNPERRESHELIKHGSITISIAHLYGDPFEAYREFLLELYLNGIEGIVWHHPDGRMAKLKGRDFK